MRRVLLAPMLLTIVLATPALAAEPAPHPPAKPAPKPASDTDHKPAKPVHPHPGGPAPARPHPRPEPKPATKPASKPAPPPAAPSPEPAAATPAEPPKTGAASGLPLPRFAALRSDSVNFRSGPGTRYPIDWVYQRRDLPVEIEREFEIWRLVRDPDGTQGWVHQATLSGRRTAVVTGAERTLRQSASAAAPAAAKLKPGVIVRLLACDAGADWCSVQVGDYRGYLRRDEIWGLLPDEVIK